MCKLMVVVARFLSLCVVLLVFPSVAAAFPIAAPGTEGLEVTVSGTSPVVATYQGNSAAFSNDLYLMLDGSGNPGDDGNPSNDLFIFNNHTSTVGSKVPLGSFPVGTKLIFRLHVNDTGKDYFTGPGSRNPDSHAHARAQADWKPNETLVSFEDLFNGPFNFNDLSFSFVPTTAVATTASFLFNVDSKRGWQSTGVKVTAGQSLTFSAKGSWTVDFRNFSKVGPDGYLPAEDSQIFQGCKLDPQLPYGKLLAGIADAPFWVIGSGGTFTADRDGFLYVRIHDADACLVDNDGTVNGKVTGEGLARREPTGQANNLVVLVHGCCTDKNDVKKDWDTLGDEIVKKIKKKKDWEIVVRDWSADTPKIISVNCLPDVFSCAHQHAIGRGLDLARAIEDYPTTYKYIHFIAHSAGANLINWAAKSLAGYKIQGNEEKPFIHLTFLDAYTPTKEDSGEEGGKGYGYLEGYPNHYSEHYVTTCCLPSTDALLKNAFNFDITYWTHPSDPVGHQWPVDWYKQSIIKPEELLYGFHISLEGGNNDFKQLSAEFPSNRSCKTSDEAPLCLWEDIPIVP